jgi:methionyl-tRNA synthetase
MEDIKYYEFKKMDLRVGKILEVEDHSEADKLYLVTVDIGEEKRKFVAGIKPYYSREELIGKLCVVIINLEPKNIRGIESHGMILAALSTDSFGILTLDRPVSPGTKIS